MKCIVYRSATRDFTYLYLRDGLGPEEIPDELRALFGPAEKVMDLELTEERTLAQEDPATVRANLAERGWHLQLPPNEDASGWLDLPRSREKSNDA